MSQYEVEHSVKTPTSKPTSINRPDLSTFYAGLDYSTSGSGAHSLPEPVNVANSYRNLANAFLSIQREELEPMVAELLASADDPPTELSGVPNEFFDQLERVDKKKLKASDECPICGNAFLEDKYPLVVRLPCHAAHMFDLECIQPWLKLKNTCPIDRKIVYGKKKDPPKPTPPTKQEEEEEEYDDMYA